MAAVVKQNFIAENHKIGVHTIFVSWLTIRFAFWVYNTQYQILKAANKKQYRVFPAKCALYKWWWLWFCPNVWAVVASTLCYWSSHYIWMEPNWIETSVNKAPKTASLCLNTYQSCSYRNITDPIWIRAHNAICINSGVKFANEMRELLGRFLPSRFAGPWRLIRNAKLAVITKSM